MNEEKNELVTAAMQIILHAGNARNEALDALSEAKKFNFEKANELLENARNSITQAHKAQTKVIQNEANGHSYEYSLLFNHAQDTLMTINSEILIAKELIDILGIIRKEAK